MDSVSLEVSTPTGSTLYSAGLVSWIKNHRRLVFIISAVVVSVLVAAAVLLWYFLSYQPSHSNDASSGNVAMNAHQQFAAWLNLNQKRYTSLANRRAAFATWSQNLELIQQLEADSNASDPNAVHWSINGPYADKTIDQFQQQILTLQRTANRSIIADAPELDEVKVATAPTTLNWATNAAMVSPIKNQGQCGDCWAFATTEAFEVGYNVAYPSSTSIVLSPQQITSCDTSDDGCNGGDPVNVYENYLAPGSGHYLTTNADYPFTSGSKGATGTCNTAAAATGFVGLSGKPGYAYAVTPTASYSTTAENQLIQALQTSPVTITVDASPWQTYSSGIMSNSAGGCSASASEQDHAVQVVGYTPTYWIVKNQWGTTWGNDGYIYLARGANTCGLFNEATQVTVTSTQGGSTTAAPATTTTSTTTTTLAPGKTTTTGKATTTTAGKATTSTTTTRRATTTTTTTTENPYYYYFYYY